MPINRKQIAEALDQIPVENLLAGSAGRELTAKQKRFARLIAEGNTGADAYRKAYNAKGTPKSVGSNASRLKADERMQLELTRLNRLNEIRELHSPAQIRAQVIERLQLEATDENNPPSARIRALELLGKVTEVAAFTERREQTVIHSSDAIKQQIMERLRSITAIDITPESDDGALSLAAELNAAEGAIQPDSEGLNQPDADPTEGVPSQPD